MSATPDPFDGMTKEQLLAIVKKLGGPVAPVGPTVAEVIDTFLKVRGEQVKRGEFSAHAYIGTRQHLGEFRQAHGDKLVSDCKQFLLTKFIADHPTWVSGWTQQGVSASIVVCFRWAMEEGLIEKAPFRRPKNLGAKNRRKPCQPAEYVALMRHGTRAFRRILFFLRRTGCRTGEARELRWENCNLDCDDPHVVIEQHKTRKKTGQARMFGLDAGTVQFLRALKRQAPTHEEAQGRVFLNIEGRPWKRELLARVFDAAWRKAGLPAERGIRLTPYTLRHMFITQAILGGMTTRKIADQVGHTTTSMIDSTYGRTTRENQSHLGRVASDAIRTRLRERPKHPEQDDKPPTE